MFLDEVLNALPLKVLFILENFLWFSKFEVHTLPFFATDCKIVCSCYEQAIFSA